MTQTSIDLAGTDNGELHSVEIVCGGGGVELVVYVGTDESDIESAADVILTPAQARKMAMYLLMRADELDG